VAISPQWKSSLIGLSTIGFVALGLWLGGPSDAADVAFAVTEFGAAWVLGDAARQREIRKQEAAERAVADERTRIARELHDVVAHHVGVIAVQAEAAAAVLPDRPDHAATAVDAISTTARDAMSELRRLLGVLRSEPGDATLAPQPGTGDVDRLVRSVRDTGVPVDLLVEGDARPLPAAVELSAYRIVQEALTNVIKHAGAARVQVVLRYEPDGLGVSVRDDGRGSLAPPTGGHGLLGMRERVDLFGGELRVGPRTEGGFEVAARLPT
jgi:signal transduction histidine kinase